MTEAVQIAVD